MKTQKIISLVLCLAICLSIFANFSVVNAADTTLDLLSFTISDDGEYYLVSAKDTSIQGEVVIPEIFDGLPVRQINSYGFKECKGITKVTLPEGIERLSTGAFMDSGLTEIVLPSTLKYIANYVFRGCTNLKNIDIPDSVIKKGDTYYAKDSTLKMSYSHIGEHAPKVEEEDEDEPIDLESDEKKEDEGESSGEDKPSDEDKPSNDDKEDEQPTETTPPDDTDDGITSLD